VNAPVSDVKSAPLADTSEDPKAGLRSVLDAINDNMAVLDTHGIIVMTNVAWQQSSLAYNPTPGQATPQSDVGSNYLDAASRCARPHDQSDRALQGIRDVLSGRMEAFSLSYPCHTSAEQRWFTLTVTPLEWEGQRGALVTHTDTTPRHRLSRR
jgi:hypothetical protein